MNKKKCFSFLLTISLLTTIVYVPVSASEYCYAAYGTPTIDGVKDDKYDGSSMIKVGDPNIAYATVWTLWDANNIYIFSQVYDKTVVDTPASTTQGWLSDSIEIFIDRNNAKTAPYQEDDLQVTIDVTGNLNGQNLKGYGKDKLGHDLDGIKYVTKKNSIGYIIEESIPLKIITGENGKKIGFDIGINNASIPGVRDNYLTWGGGGNGGTNGWNTLVMMTVVPEDFKQNIVTQRNIIKGENVALFAFASMNLPASYGNVPFYGVDGSDSSYVQATDNSNWILQVDLGYELAVDKFALLMNASNYMKTFTFEYSTDNFFWVELDNKLFDAPSPVDSYINYSFAETNMRYFRLVPKSIFGGGDLYGHAISEIKVFASRNQTIVLPDKFDDRGALKFTYSEMTKSIMEKNNARYDLTKNGSVKDLYAIYLSNLSKPTSNTQSSSETSSIISSQSEEESQLSQVESISDSASKSSVVSVAPTGDSAKNDNEVWRNLLIIALILALFSQLFFIVNKKYKFIQLKK